MTSQHSVQVSFLSSAPILLGDEILTLEVKCRNHRVRLQAVKMLEFTTHREGIWDAKIAACVAQKVMEIEEKDFYKDTDAADDFHFLSSPKTENLLLPALPESYRLHDVQIMLPDGLQGKITLRCKRRRYDGSWEDIVTECDLLSQRWRDQLGRHHAFDS